MEQVYGSQLKKRYQKPNETLQEFEAGEAGEVSNPTVPDDVYESLAIDKFLDGLMDAGTQQAVKDAKRR